jgi:hypothetical protein
VINEDGEWEKDVESTLPQEEPDFDQIAEWERQDHEDEAHGGKPCNCPVPTEEEIAAQWAERDRQHRAEAHAGGKCDCPPEEPPF